jgi:hypothetical protein
MLFHVTVEHDPETCHGREERMEEIPYASPRNGRRQ